MHGLPVSAYAPPMSTAVGIIGASGYSGIEATRLLAAHPQAQLSFVASDRWRGETVEKRLGVTGAAGALAYSGMDEVAERAARCQVVLLATPAEASLEWVPRLLERDVKVIDLSGAFRLKDAALYPTFYGFEHPRPDLLEAAVYGLPELWAEEIRRAPLVANPGCYPTGSTLSLAPLLAADLLESDSVVINAASGTTGAGRKASEELSFTEVDEDFRAYRVFQHQHGPEIAQSLHRVGPKTLGVTFTAHLLPVKRGILATAYARLRVGVDAARVREALQSFAANRPFLTVAETPNEVSLKRVVGTNRVLLSAAVDPHGLDPRRVIAISAFDNLVKGAAGQAVQNLNLLMGWDETEGLLGRRGFYP